MRLNRLFENLYFRPWLLSSGGLYALCESMGERTWARLIEQISARGEKDVAVQLRPQTDLWGDPLPQMTIRDGVAYIPVQGILACGLDPIMKMLGWTDYDDVLADVRAAEMNPAVRKIVLVFDSPGGQATGAPETGAALLRCSKPLIGYSAGQVDSAAFLLACACDSLYLRPTAEAGSIGTKIAVIDRSAAYQQMGIKVEVFASGQFKAAGTPGTSLTDPQRDDIVRTMMTINGMFTGFVQKTRTRIAEDSMQGQVFVGPDATAAYIADGLVGSIDELHARLR